MPRRNGRFMDENFLIMSMLVIVEDWRLQCCHFAKWSWISVVLRWAQRRGPGCWRRVLPTPWLVAAFGQLFKAFSGFASAEILYSFQMGLPLFGQLFDAHYWYFGKYILQPGWKVIHNHDVWQQLHALKMGVRNKAKMLSFCFLQVQPQQETLKCNCTVISIWWHVWLKK